MRGEAAVLVACESPPLRFSVAQAKVVVMPLHIVLLDFVISVTVIYHFENNGNRIKGITVSLVSRRLQIRRAWPASETICHAGEFEMHVKSEAQVASAPTRTRY